MDFTESYVNEVWFKNCYNTVMKMRSLCFPFQEIVLSSTG